MHKHFYLPSAKMFLVLPYKLVHEVYQKVLFLFHNGQSRSQLSTVNQNN